MENTTRRKFLSTMGVLTIVGLTGCIGSNNEERINIEDYPISREADKWPSIGNNPLDSDVTLVVLDDPSCPRCASFHQNTVPKIKSNFISNGLGSLVIRPYPVVYEWGLPASHSLEAVYDRNEQLFWSLIDFYFSKQNEFSTENVHDKTKKWLDRNEEINSESVIDDVRNNVYSDRIKATMDAAESVSAGRATPAIFMFKDNIFQTKVSGSVSYTGIETALDL